MKRKRSGDAKVALGVLDAKCHTTTVNPPTMVTVARRSVTNVSYHTSTTTTTSTAISKMKSAQSSRTTVCNLDAKIRKTAAVRPTSTVVSNNSKRLCTVAQQSTLRTRNTPTVDESVFGSSSLLRFLKDPTRSAQDKIFAVESLQRKIDEPFRLLKNLLHGAPKKESKQERRARILRLAALSGVERTIAREHLRVQRDTEYALHCNMLVQNASVCQTWEDIQETVLTNEQQRRRTFERANVNHQKKCNLRRDCSELEWKGLVLALRLFGETTTPQSSCLPNLSSTNAVFVEQHNVRHVVRRAFPLVVSMASQSEVVRNGCTPTLQRGCWLALAVGVEPIPVAPELARLLKPTVDGQTMRVKVVLIRNVDQPWLITSRYGVDVTRWDGEGDRDLLPAHQWSFWDLFHFKELMGAPDAAAPPAEDFRLEYAYWRPNTRSTRLITWAHEQERLVPYTSSLLQMPKGDQHSRQVHPFQGAHFIWLYHVHQWLTTHVDRSLPVRT